MALSIIIPTLNEAGYLAETIETARNHAEQDPPEIIVIDCGSTDATTTIAEKTNVKCRVHPEADHRAAALNAGVREANGDILLFLDADTLLPPHYDTAVHHALSSDRVVGGAFPLSFREARVSLRIIAFLNHLRYRVSQRYFGDQAVFVKRRAYERAGGLPDRSLLASAHFCDHLKQAGRLRLIAKKPVLTSGRRFLEHGILRTLLWDGWILLLDFLNLPVEKYGKAYWQANRERGLRTK